MIGDRGQTSPEANGNRVEGQRSIAYFSMEIAVAARMPTYSGGLGILSGDTLRSAADLEVPVVAVTLLHRSGYFYQLLGPTGLQREEPVRWIAEDFLQTLPQRAAVVLEGRTVQIRAWKYEIQSMQSYRVPIYFLDTDLPENAEDDRRITDLLYGGDQRYRLCQEVILGIGGIRILRALGYQNITRYHLNEGHASLLILELLSEEAQKTGRQSVTFEDIVAVRNKCVFTTHTPVPSAHDQFPMELVRRVLGQREIFLDMQNLMCCGHLFDPTFLALNLSHYVNGVAKRHGQISKLMFGDYPVDSITNGVHVATWVAAPFRRLYDLHIPGWRQNNHSLRYARSIPKEEVWEAHTEAKKQLIQHVNRETNAGMEMDVFTIGFGRRVTVYKRGDLLFYDIPRLRKIASQTGRFQIIYAGKAHPHDQEGKDIIRRIFEGKDALKNEVNVAYLLNYDIEVGRLMTSGVDLWLNTPQPPLEASGTSGMKAALNGVPSLSVLDGWWIEGHIEGVTGWSIGEEDPKLAESSDASQDAYSLYDKMERVIIPMFYREQNRYLEVMLHAIALNGSFFNTERMLREYVAKAYV